MLFRSVSQSRYELTNTITPTNTPSPTITSTPTQTPTPTITPTSTPTETITQTPTNTPTSSLTPTPTPSLPDEGFLLQENYSLIQQEDLSGILIEFPSPTPLKTPPKPKRMIIYFVAITTILFAIMMFIYNVHQNSSVKLLSAYLFIYSFYAITHYTTFYSTNPTLVAICWNNLSPIFTLGGPVLFFYVKSSLEDKIIWKWSDLIHLIPFIIICFGLFPYLLSPFENKLHAANLIIQDVNNIKKIPMNSIFSNLFIYLSRPLMAIIYISASIRLLIRKNNSEKNCISVIASSKDSFA